MMEDGSETVPTAAVVGLSYGEQLLLWSLRRLATQGHPSPLVTREFTDACGADAAEVLTTFRAFLGVLAFGGRRRLSVGHPGCLQLTWDERRLLALVAIAQDGDDAWLDAHLCWLVRGELTRQLALAARALAAELADHDLRLPLPGQVARGNRAAPVTAAV
jgi:hypothetical protein